MLLLTKTSASVSREHWLDGGHVGWGFGGVFLEEMSFQAMPQFIVSSLFHYQ